MTNKALTEFTNRHSIRVIDNSKRAHKHTRSNVQLFKFDDDYNKFINDHLTFETEVLLTVEISESEMERIAKFEEQVFNNLSNTGHYNLFETLMEQKEQEQRLKDKFPAVKKAYEQYSLLLKMAGSGEI